MTHLTIQFVNKSLATSTPQLTYLNTAGNAIIKVDNTSTVAYNNKRDTVRIQSTDSYDVGSVWVLDAVHLPYGCSVWPAFWSYGTGKTWPQGGEIDVIEGVNNQVSNQMALHTESGWVFPFWFSFFSSYTERSFVVAAWTLVRAWSGAAIYQIRQKKERKANFNLVKDAQSLALPLLIQESSTILRVITKITITQVAPLQSRTRNLTVQHSHRMEVEFS